jgi:hypothetical protein
MSYDGNMNDNHIITYADKVKIVAAIKEKSGHYKPRDGHVSSIDDVFINPQGDIEVSVYEPGGRFTSPYVFDMTDFTYVIVPWTVFLIERLDNRNVHMFLQ